MNTLKSNNSINGIIPAIFSLLMLGISSFIWGINTGLNVLGTIIFSYSLIFGLWPFIKTNNRYFLVSFLYMVALGTFMIIFDPDMLKSRGGRLDALSGSLIVLIYFSLFWLLYLLFNKKLKWRGREVMELAALHVQEGEDSYTDRPLPSGKIQGINSEIIDFGKYLRKNLVFMAFEKADRIILVPVKMGNEYKTLFTSNIDDADFTKISIDFNGNISVHISRKDYLDYKEDLSFHDLCVSLGNLVVKFYDQYIKQEEVRIIDKVNSIKIGYFS